MLDSHASGASLHAVRFVRSPGEAGRAAALHLHDGLQQGAPALYVMRNAHVGPLRAQLGELGYDVGALERSGRLVELATERTLDALVVDGALDAARFDAHLAAPVRAMHARGGSPPHIHGELVDVLMERGEPELAIDLEQAWDGVLDTHTAHLQCGYRLDGFASSHGHDWFERVCGCHGHVHPSSSEHDHHAPGRGVSLEEVRALRLSLARSQREVQQLRAAHPDAEPTHVDRLYQLETLELLVGGAIHDFANLLTVMNWSAARAAEELPATWPQREALRTINDAADHATRLVRGLLSLSNRGAGDPQLRGTPEAVHLGDALLEIEPLLLSLVKRGTTLSVECHRDCGTVRIDSTHFIQIMTNLVANARDASGEGGRIELTARAARRPDPTSGAPRAYGAVDVRDDGAGMNAATRARAFEVGFTTKGAQGTGLGLASVQRLVVAAGGFVEVESELGCGTCFTIYLPVL